MPVDFVGNTFSVDFFDHAFTFSNRSSNVTCCLADNSFKVATCGKGASCAGQCSALGASLCPSGNCTSDPKTCQFDFDKISTDDRQRGRSDVTGSSSSLRSCFPRCKVVEDESCCFHKKCFEKRPKLCNWANFTTGKIHFEFPIQNISPQARNVLCPAACQRESGLVKRRSCPSLELLSWMRVPRPTQVSD